MKKIITFIIIITCFTFSACDYLDTDPEKKGTLDEAFADRDATERFLYSCYSFLPKSNEFNGEPQILGAGDEATLTSQWATTWHFSKVVNIGSQTAGDPIYNYWSSFKSLTQASKSEAYDLYGAIRQCYTFIERAPGVPNVDPEELDLWMGEAKFLVAYYHYLLLRLYGPIVIVEDIIPLDAPEELYYSKRKPYDECVEWIAARMDEAETLLPQKPKEMGRPTKTLAKALKARMFLYAASPLFNGNSEFYSTFKNKSGEHLISQEYNKEKWLRALTATEEAITEAENADFKLFEYPNIPSSATPEERGYLNARYAVIMLPTEGNKDVIWAFSAGDMNLQQMIGARGISIKSTTIPYGGISPSFMMVESYLTKNGLPIDKDPKFIYENRYQPTQDEHGQWTALGHLDREPRFYAQVAYDRAFNYELNSASSPQKYTLYFRMGEINPQTKQVNGNDQLRDSSTPNGYLTKKFLHPNSSFENNGVAARKKIAFPLMRVTELYLNYAEAYYEYNGNLSGKALNYINEIRKRAGIPDVETAWTGVPGKDYREIIRRERTVELMFEGHRFFDARRWKTAHHTFSTVQKRWNCFPTGFSNSNPQPYDNYLKLFDSAEPLKSFETKHYLYPIDMRDININHNLVQNPGW